MAGDYVDLANSGQSTVGVLSLPPFISYQQFLSWKRVVLGRGACREMGKESHGGMWHVLVSEVASSLML